VFPENKQIVAICYQSQSAHEYAHRQHLHKVTGKRQNELTYVYTTVPGMKKKVNERVGLRDAAKNRSLKHILNRRTED
jgi:hypothetical protein